MSTASLLSSPNASVSVRRILAVVCRSVESALAVLCRRRYDAEVTVKRLDRTATDQPIRLRLECADQIEMDTQIRVSHVGGNVYDVRCTVPDGSSRRCTYSVPGSGTTLSPAPELGRTLGTFLLDELERQIGSRHLRGQ
jgi:hypothetical protein